MDTTTGDHRQGRQTQRRRYRWFAFLWLACLVMLTARAGTPSTALMAQAELWTDPGGQLQPAEVLQHPGGWQAYTGSFHVPRSTAAAVWLRFRPAASASGPLFFEVSNPSVDQVEFFEPSDHGWVRQVSGDLTAHADWPVDDRLPVVRLAMPDSAKTYLVRIQNSTSVQLSGRWLTSNQMDRGKTVYLLLGACAGLGLLVGLMAVVISFSQRDMAMGVFAGYALSSLMMLAINHGLASQYFWPRSPEWSHFSRALMTWIPIGFGLWTCTEVAGLRYLDRMLWRSLRALVIGVLFAGLTSPFWPEQTTMTALNLTAIATMLVSLAVLGYAHQRGNRHALATAIAFTPMLLGVLPPILRGLGVLDIDSTVAWYAMALASALELPALLWILSRRTRERRELEIRNAALSNHDKLTGLATLRVARIRLEQTIARVKRFEHTAALLLIDIANLEAIQARFGRDTAEAALVEAARRLRRLPRDIDTLARLRGARFALIAEGPLTRAEISSIATHVVASGLAMPTPLPDLTVLKFTVVIAPLDPSTTPTRLLVERAATLLDQVSALDDSKSIRWLDANSLFAGMPGPETQTE